MWLVSGGKARLKARLSEHVGVDAGVLPYDPRVVTWLREEKAKGRRLVLATASHDAYAREVSEHLGLFEQMLATTGDRNLQGARKRDALVEAFGEKGFDYVGNSADDLPIWQAADNSYVVNPEPGVARRAEKLGNLRQVFEAPGSAWHSWLKALRLHQWLKNLLIFVPLLASHQMLSLASVGTACLAFLLFGLCASSVYLLNDLLDLNDDRHHPRKRHRPLAAGAIPIKAAIRVVPLLLAAAFGGSLLWMPLAFSATLALYYAMTLAYSLQLKRLVMVDVVTLAMLYTSRVIAGTAAIQANLTFWLLAFSMFMFLSLALVKRFAELKAAKLNGKARGRGYVADDLEVLAQLGSASGYLAVLVLALYIQEPGTQLLYRHPHIIWLACPLLLFWVSRTWLLTHRGQMHDDPVVFAIKDRISLVVGGLFVLVVWLAA
ncbi:MAG: UbiA family prenyltransferase [Gammaproteobacteria bacterium]|nr:UbiA family prenyltransferase [Gammaproteobacteria bacterium]